MWEYNHTSNLAHSAYADRPYYAVAYDDELYHYGILGMKWGVRKERPTSGNGRGRGRKKLTARQKKIIRNVAIGAGVTGAAVGGALLAKKFGPRFAAGIRRNKQAMYATKGMTEAQLRLMRQRGLESGRKYDVKAASRGLKRLRREAWDNAHPTSLFTRENLKAAGKGAIRGAALGSGATALVMTPLIANKKTNEKTYNANEAYRQQMASARSTAKTKLGKAYYGNQEKWAHRNINDQVYLARKRKGKI